MPKRSGGLYYPLLQHFVQELANLLLIVDGKTARSLLNRGFIPGVDAVVDLVSTAQVLLPCGEYLSKLKYQLLQGLLMSLVHGGSVYTQQSYS